MENPRGPEGPVVRHPTPPRLAIVPGELVVEALAPREPGRRSSFTGLVAADALRDAPLLRFSSGVVGLPARRAVMRAFNAQDYAAARRLLAEHEAAFTDFQRSATRFALAIVAGQPRAAAALRSTAARLAEAPHEAAALLENDAFALLQRGLFAEARALCREALVTHPTTEGLWVNLLVALARLDEGQAIEALLLRLPRVLDLERGLLGRYIAHDPGFQAAACNGG
jgi:tetratricopeptide (TPR) repeat protein